MYRWAINEGFIQPKSKLHGCVKYGFTGGWHVGKSNLNRLSPDAMNLEAENWITSSN
jgi:hypothetical protein